MGFQYIFNFEFKIRNDLSINSKDIELIGVELWYETETLYLMLSVDHIMAKQNHFKTF